MNKLLIHRLMHANSNKDLRRARSLYAYIIFEKVIGDKEALVEACYRCRERGLYSEKTAITDVCWSIMKRLCKLDVEANPELYKKTNGLYKFTCINGCNWLQFNYGIRRFNETRRWFRK